MIWHMPQSTRALSEDALTAEAACVLEQALLLAASIASVLLVRCYTHSVWEGLHCKTKCSTDLLYFFLLLWQQGSHDLLQTLML